MNISAFLTKIQKTFTRNDVEDKIRNASKKIDKALRPAMELVFESLDESNAKSAYAKAVAKDFNLALPTRLKSERRPVAVFLPKAVVNAGLFLEQLEQYVDKNFMPNIHIEGISYQKATVLRMIELIDFFVEYSIRHLHYFTASETNIEDYGHPDGKASTQDEVRYLESNRGSWINLMSILQNDPKAAMKQVSEIPEIVLGDADAGSVPALAGASADPLHLGAIPLVSNMFRWVGIRLVHWEVERYERALKARRVIELRLENRRARLAGTTDAAAEAVVMGYENELILVNQRIKKMEEKM